MAGSGPDDRALLIAAAADAAVIAMAHWRRDPKVFTKPDDSPVTEADLAVDARLRAALRAARPDYGWLSEETEDDAARMLARRVFVVDPIDGTRAYVEGQTAWSHSLAVVEAGRPVAAVVMLPAQGKVYAAAEGMGATLNGAPIAASRREDVAGARLLAAKSVMRGEHWRGGAATGVERHFRPSLAYRLALVAEGRFDAMLTLRPSWDWDIAAGALLVAEAGGRATDASGAPLRFNTEGRRNPGVLAAGAVHGGLRAALG